MNQETEKAFTESDRVIRAIADLKHEIAFLKASDKPEKKKLEILMAFRSAAECALKDMGDSIGSAIYDLDKVDRPQPLGDLSAHCGECGYPTGGHSPFCPAVSPVDPVSKA